MNPVLNEVKLGAWDNGGPFEGSIIWNGMGDCSFLSAMAVILRKNASALTNTIGKATSLGWSISLYLLDGTPHRFLLEYDTIVEEKAAKLSKIPWVAYYERARLMWLDLNKKNGSSPLDVFQMFYGPKANITFKGPCLDVSAMGKLATKSPLVYDTAGKESTEKHLPFGHSYAVHDANATHIILRNPWGIVMKYGEK